MIVTQTTNGKFYKNWLVEGMFDEESARQVAELTQLPFVKPYIAVMPDAHAGKGSCVGTIIPTRGAIIPATVGVDLSCGMLSINTMIQFQDIESDIEKIFNRVSSLIPMGKSHYDVRKDKGVWQRHNMPSIVGDVWKSILMKRYETVYELVRPDYKSFSHQLGTLGGGNHFIELCTDKDNYVWLTIHSGSRGIGHKIASHYISIAEQLMEKYFISLPNKDLSYLVEGTDEFKSYMFCREWAHDFAWLSRCLMADIILDEIGVDTSLRFLNEHFDYSQEKMYYPQSTELKIHCPHNYIDRENFAGMNLWITRKGAIRARLGDFGIIPGSMGAKTYLVKGLGNQESFCSASHGAGRLMSRTKAKENFTEEDFKNQTEGILCRKDAGVLDEIPKAYKPIELVMEAQKDLVEPINILKQFICWKG